MFGTQSRAWHIQLGTPASNLAVRSKAPAKHSLTASLLVSSGAHTRPHYELVEPMPLPIRTSPSSLVTLHHEMWTDAQ